jgi:hypothetical protein
MLVLTISAVFVVWLIAGCEEEKVSEPELTAKQDRLVASRLKTRLEEQQKLHARQRESQKRLLEKCMQEKAALEEMSSKGIEDYMENVLADIVKENETLRGEIEDLKAQIQKLKAE